MWNGDTGDADDHASAIGDSNTCTNGHPAADGHASAHHDADHRGYSHTDGDVRDAHCLDVTGCLVRDAASR
jgi:hypothetical protein